MPYPGDGLRRVGHGAHTAGMASLWWPLRVFLFWSAATVVGMAAAVLVSAFALPLILPRW